MAEDGLRQRLLRSSHGHSCVQLLQVALGGLCPVLPQVGLCQVELSAQVCPRNWLVVVQGQRPHASKDHILGCRTDQEQEALAMHTLLRGSMQGAPARRVPAS